MANESGKYLYVDALRGIAILIVVLLHASQAVPPDTSALAWTMSKGELGVQLFYVMSAITLCMSWEARSSTEPLPVRSFLLRRFFRIAPMFYLAIIVSLLANGFAPRHWAPDGIDGYTVLLTALFAHGWHPETINSLVPGGWSITVEMTFYLLLPILLIKTHSLRSRLLVLMLSLGMYFIWRSVWVSTFSGMYPPDRQYLVTGSLYYSFFTQLPVFITGTVAYLLMRDSQVHARVVKVGGAGFLVLLVAAIVFLPFGVLNRLASNHLVGGLLFSLLALTLAQYPSSLICNPLIVFLGRISYSLYLSHFGVVGLFKHIGFEQLFPRDDLGFLAYFICILMVAAPVSWLCYRLIELPGIALGRRVIARLASGQPANVRGRRWLSISDRGG